MTNNAIVLLSGGLDSCVSLALIRESFENILTLTFDYGQKSRIHEIETSRKISEYYSVENKLISIPFLSEVCSSNKDDMYVPNRNALFVNIAACYAESMGYNFIVLGANKEESAVYKDNSSNFVSAINASFKNSMNASIELIAPLINMDKTEIVKTAININFPLELVYTCYLGENKNCGECDSCKMFKNALIQNNKKELLEKIFDR